MEARDRTERIKRRADIAREKEAQKESDGSPVSNIPSRLTSGNGHESSKTPPPNGSSSPPSGRSSDPITQTISMASQISQGIF